jgi:hypothetical protein
VDAEGKMLAPLPWIAWPWMGKDVKYPSCIEKVIEKDVNVMDV